MDAKAIIRAFKTTGTATLDLPITEKEFGTAAESFRKILQLPEDILLSTQVQPPIPNTTPYGFTVKRAGWKKGEWHDGKIYCHIAPLLLESKDVLRIMGTHSEAADFFNRAFAIRRTFEETALRLLNTLESQFPGLKQPYITGRGEIPNLTVRFLAYQAVAESGHIGQGHVDKSGFTLTGWESAPGLRTFTPKKKEPQCVTYTPGISTAMVGKLASQQSGGVLPSTWHDVVQPPHHRISKDILRIAIVCFVDPRLGTCDIPGYQETHLATA